MTHRLATADHVSTASEAAACYECDVLNLGDQ